MRASFIAAFLLLSRFAMAGDDVEILPCDSVEGFQTALPGGDKPADAVLKAKKGLLVLKYERSKMAPLANYALLTELKELRLRITSAETATFVVVVKDRDGATWNQPFRLEGGAWTDVVLAAGKFALNADSAVKKERFDPARLGAGWVLFDAAAVLGNAKGANEVEVEEVRIVREPIEETAGDWIVENEQLVAKSRKYTGRITVKKGGKLTVSAPRFVHAGELSLEGGTAEFLGGSVNFPQRFQHDRDLRLTGESRLTFRDALVVTHFPAGLKLDGAQSVEMSGVECVGGFTADVPPKAKILLSKTKSPGEFVIAPGGTVDVADCENVILWHTFGKGRIELEDSTVNGKGGYVGAHDESVIRLVHCKITCLVVARKRSRIELVDCEVEGDIRAVDEGHIELTRTTFTGVLQMDGDAVIEGK